MDKPSHGKSAFPFQWDCAHDATLQAEEGMAKIEYFAALAMQGICVQNVRANGEMFLPSRKIAETAVQIAKATIDELDKLG